MLNPAEIKFIHHWQSVREEYSTTKSKFIRGLPMAMLFSFPIIISIMLVYMFSPEWYTKISNSATGASWMILIAVLLIIFFFAFARMHFKWEMNEQLYQELLHKKENNKKE
jgi:hypothetical protein